MQKLETKRHSLSQQSSLVAEAESLNTALASHSLNTLSQRYNIFKRSRNEYAACRQALLDHATAWTTQMTIYLGCLDSIQCRRMREYMSELSDVSGALQSHPVTHEFDLLKEFLDNSAQTAIYVQSSQMANEMHSMMSQQIRVVQLALDQLEQYGAVIQYQPPSSRIQHRIVKCSEWCQYLADRHTVQDCHEVVSQFQATLGKNAAAKVPLHQIVSFSCQLQTNIRNGQFKLDELLEQLRTEAGNGDFDASDAMQIFGDRYLESKSTIATFVREKDASNAVAMRLVAAKTLCDLNSRFLLMEKAAASSADNLVDLTFNGNWYLDEICTNSSIAIDLCEAFQTANASVDSPLIAVLRELRDIYGQLKSSHESLRSALGDFIQAVIGEDRDVLDMITVVSSLQEGLQTIPEMLSNLNSQLRGNANGGSLNDVLELKRRLNAMRAQFTVTNDGDRGRKLFAIFDNIFDAIQQKHQSLIEHCRGATVPGHWQRINHIKDSVDLAVSQGDPRACASLKLFIHFQAFVLDANAHTVLTDIFMVKLLEAMVEIFTFVLQFACAFKGTGMCPAYDDDQLCRPLRKIISDFVLRQMLGLQPFLVAVFLCHWLEDSGIDIEREANTVDIGASNTLSMDEMCRKAIDLSSRLPLPTLSLNRSSSLCMNTEFACRKFSAIRGIQTRIEQQNEYLLRSQRLLAAHSWMHEEALSTQPGFGAIATINRKTIVVKMSEAAQVMKNLRTAIQKKRDELMVLVTAITQRLKWAVGANPDLQQLMNEFTTSACRKQEAAEKLSYLATVALSDSLSVLQYEQLRISSAEAIEEDQKFLKLVSRWEKSCVAKQSCATMVTPTEEALVELLDPEGPIDKSWLNNVASLIDEMMDLVHQEIVQCEKGIVTVQDELQSCAYRMRSLMTTHQRLAGRVLAFLKPFHAIVTEAQKAKISEQLERHNGFLVALTDLHGHVLSKDFTEEIVINMLREIEDHLQNIENVFLNLISVNSFCAERSQQEGVSSSMTLQPPIIGELQHEGSAASRPTSPSKSKNAKGSHSKAFTISIVHVFLAFFRSNRAEEERVRGLRLASHSDEAGRARSRPDAPLHDRRASRLDDSRGHRSEQSCRSLRRVDAMGLNNRISDQHGMIV